MTPPKITWFACGEAKKDRIGLVLGHHLTINYFWAQQRHELCFNAHFKGSFAELEAAQRHAQRHILTWLDEHRHQQRITRTAAAAHALRALGVDVHDSRSGWLTLDLEAAEALVTRLSPRTSFSNFLKKKKFLVASPSD